MHDSINPDRIGPDDPGYDSTSAFTGKPLTQKAKEANDLRKKKNLAMLAGLPGGKRRYRVTREIAIGGTKEHPKLAPRSFIIDGVAGSPVFREGEEDIMAASFSSTNALDHADHQCGVAWAALPGKVRAE